MEDRKENVVRRGTGRSTGRKRKRMEFRGMLDRRALSFVAGREVAAVGRIYCMRDGMERRGQLLGEKKLEMLKDWVGMVWYVGFQSLFRTGLDLKTFRFLALMSLLGVCVEHKVSFTMETPYCSPVDRDEAEALEQLVANQQAFMLNWAREEQARAQQAQELQRAAAANANANRMEVEEEEVRRPVAAPIHPPVGAMYARVQQPNAGRPAQQGANAQEGQEGPDVQMEE